MIVLNRYDYKSDYVKKAREAIIDEIVSSGQDTHYLDWFGNNWDQQNYISSDILTLDDDLVMLTASEYTHEGQRIKIGCRQYQMIKYRSKYHSATHKYIVPFYVDFCKKNGIRYLWYSFHAFNTRLERYAKSHIRLMSATNSNDIPYYKSFKLEGIINYKGVDQYSFVCDLENL